MLAIDIGICIPFLGAGVFWSRGVWKKSKGDIIFSGVMLLIAIIAYAYCYRFTSLIDVPCVFLIICTIIATIIVFIRRRHGFSLMFIATCILVPAFLSVGLFFVEEEWNASSNSLFLIAPYKLAGTWVFDDARVGLHAEPFLSGIPELIDKLVADARIQNAGTGFRLIFSLQPFPGYQTKVVWRRAGDGGNWYYSEKYNIEGWLCQALFKYFKRAPKEIYVKAEAQ